MPLLRKSERNRMNALGGRGMCPSERPRPWYFPLGFDGSAAVLIESVEEGRQGEEA